MYQALQGNLGLAKAIEYFTSIGVTVSIPLNDTQPYDLVADIDGKLNKISVKTGRSRAGKKSFYIQLRNTGGGRKGNIRQVNFDNSSCDYLFVYTIDEALYLIPANKVQATAAIQVGGAKYEKYKVNICTFENFIKTKI